MLVAKKFIYCWWLALWAFLFYVNLVPISPLFSWTFAAIFTTTAIVFFNTSERMSITLKLIFVATELIILYTVYNNFILILQNILEHIMKHVVGPPVFSSRDRAK